MDPVLVTFVGGESGSWSVERLVAVRGEPVQPARRVASLAYLPRIARRLHHGRDLAEPFDFITWFEFAPGDAGAFDELCGLLRATEEWSFVEREVDIRLLRVG